LDVALNSVGDRPISGQRLDGVDLDLGFHPIPTRLCIRPDTKKSRCNMNARPAPSEKWAPSREAGADETPLRSRSRSTDILELVINEGMVYVNFSCV
jgi:hypothetical protein